MDEGWEDYDPALVAAADAYEFRKFKPLCFPYPAYLHSEHWQTTRRRALYRAGFECKACEATKPLSVHHMSYKRIGREEEADLIVLCQPCHDLVHELLRVNDPRDVNDLLIAYPRRLARYA